MTTAKQTIASCAWLAMLLVMLACQSAIGQTAPRAPLDGLEELRPLQPLGPAAANGMLPERPEIETYFAKQRFLPQDNDSEIDRLQKLRLQSAAKLVGVRIERFNTGFGDSDATADAVERLLDAYLLLEESNEQRVEAFRQILQPVQNFDGSTRGRLERGLSSVADAALARHVRLDVTIRILDELSVEEAESLFGLHFPPIHPTLAKQETVAAPQFSRPTIDFGDRQQGLSNALPAFFRPRATELDDDLVRLKKLQYSAATVEVAARQAAFSTGQHPFETLWEASDRLATAAANLDLSDENEAGLLEQLTLLAHTHQQYFVQRIDAGSGSTRGLARAEYQLFKTATRLVELLSETGLTSELSLAELLKQSDASQKLVGNLAQDFPHLVRLRPQTHTGQPEDELLYLLRVATCNAATRAFLDAVSRRSALGESIEATVSAIEDLLESAMAVESDTANQKLIINEATEFSKRLELEAKARLESGVGRVEDHAFAKLLHLDLQLLHLTHNETARD